MRILHLTDTHIGSVMHVLGSPSGWSREADHLTAMETALQPALQGQVDLVVHSGDLYNRSRPSARAMHGATRLLRRVARQVPVVLMPGNHDRRGIKRSLPMGVPGLHVFDSPSVFRYKGLRLGVMPFRRQAARWAEEAAALDCEVLVAHQAFHGARVPGFTFRVGAQKDTLGAQHLPPRLRWVMCGHIHPRQVTSVGEVQVVQPGSTERTSFSEADETKGYAMWEFGRRVTYTFVDLPARPMRRIRYRAQLAGLQPGTLVHSELPLPELLQRGLLVVPRRERIPRPVSQQAALFS
jgi:DNA repair protein SbcD/Mre11